MGTAGRACAGGADARAGYAAVGDIRDRRARSGRLVARLRDGRPDRDVRRTWTDRAVRGVDRVGAGGGRSHRARRACATRVVGGPEGRAVHGSGVADDVVDRAGVRRLVVAEWCGGGSGRADASVAAGVPGRCARLGAGAGTGPGAPRGIERREGKELLESLDSWT